MSQPQPVGGSALLATAAGGTATQREQAWPAPFPTISTAANVCRQNLGQCALNAEPYLWSGTRVPGAPTPRWHPVRAFLRLIRGTNLLKHLGNLHPLAPAVVAGHTPPGASSIRQRKLDEGVAMRDLPGWLIITDSPQIIESRAQSPFGRPFPTRSTEACCMCGACFVDVGAREEVPREGPGDDEHPQRRG